MSINQAISIPGRALISRGLRRVVRAALDQRSPSPDLVRALNDLLGLTGDELATNEKRSQAS